MLLATLQDLGSLRSGSEGRPPSRDASGELVRELRYNDDRYIGPTAMRMVASYAKMAESAWLPLLAYGWDIERMIEASGSQNRARFLLIQPQIFEGAVNVKPVPESAIPEGRDTKQQKIERWYAEGMFGQPGSPEARRMFFELINYPHLDRAARPGGVDQEMAEWENAQMMRGQPLMPHETHDDEIHLAIHREIEASPDYYQLNEDVRLAFELHRRAHEQALQNKILKALVKTGAMTDAAGDAIPGQEAPAANAGATKRQPLE